MTGTFKHQVQAQNYACFFALFICIIAESLLMALVHIAGKLKFGAERKGK
jgi:hypothetical protein